MKDSILNVKSSGIGQLHKGVRRRTKKGLKIKNRRLWGKKSKKGGRK